MKVCEIFTSIQGESSQAGLVSTFIRFTGCNLRCLYCDTKYAYEGGMELSEDEIMNEVSLVGVRLVTITGGEPLLQEGVEGLIERLISEGHDVLIETNGSLSVKDLDKRAKIVMDIKTPKSGMWDEMDMSNVEYLKPEDEIKFVVVDRTDYDWAKKLIERYGLIARFRVLLSPAFGGLEPKTLAEWILKDRLDVRFNLQIHKYIFGYEKEGLRTT